MSLPHPTRRHFVLAKFVLLAALLGALPGCEAPPAPSSASLAAEPDTQQSEKAESNEQRDADEPSAAKEPDGGHKHTNRLADETSPYLLLHAHNPVDWYPWGEEALAKAKKENKPIFLSIGYSSCYWCHVMERESFMDDEIARFLNEHFVCIKIDREERPDIDQIYMTALQVMGRRGGWPLSVFLTPAGKPFFGGTYWPARDGDRGAPTGFLTVAQKVHEFWDENTDRAKQLGEAVAEAVGQQLGGRKPVEVIELDRKMIEGVMDDLQDQFDPTWGGFGYSPSNPRQPKFPEPSNLMFLLQRAKNKDIERAEEAEEMLTLTLDKMAQGGIYDHLGGGFHRYSTDRYWHIPHFEKMLYDNGQLATVYAEAYKLTGDEAYRRVVEGILNYVQREMTDEGGGFYSALDAETDAEEGKFYRWEKDELDQLLTGEDGKLFREVYSLDGEPNFEEHYHVPMLSQPLAKTAEEKGMTPAELKAKLAPVRETLFAIRSKRDRPLRDTKILTGWNGLMIRGFADAGRLLEDRPHIDAAARAADFVVDNLATDDGRLLRTHTAGEAKLNAYLDDYAFLVDGLIALHRATGEAKWLTLADRFTARQIELFWDEANGGFFYTSNDHEQLIARAKDPIDTVLPSGNSVSAGNLLYLADALDKPNYLKNAERTMRSSAVYLRASPGAVPRMAVHVSQFLQQHGHDEPDADAPDAEAPDAQAAPREEE